MPPSCSPNKEKSPGSRDETSGQELAEPFLLTVLSSPLQNACTSDKACQAPCREMHALRRKTRHKYPLLRPDVSFYLASGSATQPSADIRHLAMTSSCLNQAPGPAADSVDSECTVVRTIIRPTRSQQTSSCVVQTTLEIATSGQGETHAPPRLRHVMQSSDWLP